MPVTAGPQARADTPTRNLPRLVTLAAELARAGPPIDAVKIAQLRAAIADGRYTVDANAIARGLQQAHPRRDR